jgi:hypothetical protein
VKLAKKERQELLSLIGQKLVRLAVCDPASGVSRSLINQHDSRRCPRRLLRGNTRDAPRFKERIKRRRDHAALI